MRDHHTGVTRSTYDRIARAFLERTVDRRGIRHMRRQFMAALPRDALILDIGCGPGFDADHFRGEGHRAIGIDLSHGMLRLASEEYGAGAYVQADMRHLPCGRTADGIWACASMLHLERENFPGVLSGFGMTLKPGGVLCFSLKAGDGDEWDTRYGADCRRWFTFWSETDVDGHLRDHGFEILDPEQDRPDGSSWIRRLARRR